MGNISNLQKVTGNSPGRAGPSVKGLIWIAAGLVALVVVTMGLLLTYFSDRQAALVARKDQERLAYALSVQSRQLATTATDYSWWDETVEQVRDGIDPDWAASNIGLWLFESLGVAATVVFDTNDHVVYSSIDGESKPVEACGAICNASHPFIDTARASPRDDPHPVTAYLEIDGSLMLVAAAAITWEEPEVALADEAPRAVLVIAKPVNVDFLADLAEGLHLDGLVALPVDGVPEGRASLPLSGPDGQPVRRISWDPSDEAFMLLTRVGGALVAVLAAAVSLFVLFVFLYRRYAAEVEKTYRSYAQQQKETEKSVIIAGEAKFRADQTLRSRAGFLTGLSHEFRSPLSAIIGFAELMTREVRGPLPNEDYKSYAENILQAGKHLLGLVDDVLDLSKLEHGRHALHESDFDLKGVVEECMDFLALPLEEKSLSVTNDLPDGFLLHADRRTVLQMMINLLSNAAKFTPDGGAIDIVAQLEDGLRLEVRDTGPGISAEDRERILMPFERVEDGYSAASAGLGLPITKGLIELHGGRLEVLPREPKGSIFRLVFPADRTVAESDTQTAIPEEDVNLRAAGR